MKQLTLTFVMVFMLVINSYLYTPFPLMANPSTDKLRLAHFATREKAIQWAESRSWPVREELIDNQIIELHSVQPWPVYRVTTNHNAAQTISTDRVWTESGSNLNLTGQNVNIAMWDAGRVLDIHQEFDGRISHVDESVFLNEHSTWVAGTICARGIVREARGMANEARLMVYEWNYDLFEMTAAADSGMLISNHSYGFLAGWVWNFRNDQKWTWLGDPSTDPQEDYHFGFYNDLVKEWDKLAYKYPYYLIVKAAGNQRADSGPDSGESHWIWDSHKGDWQLSTVQRKPDGDYDCLVGPAVAKNVLTVGAVDDVPNGYSQPLDVVMSPVSSWGPTDDGRIKPDVVANGIGLYSTSKSGSDKYGFYGGTSSATASASGSLALLQQCHHDNYKKYMKASTLKALVIHTADQAGGNEGPDYKFGWGLLNIHKATKFIQKVADSAKNILELSVQEYEPYTFIGYSDGSRPIKLTLCWMDAPGESPAISLDPTKKMLMNDMDVRIEHLATGEIYSPWILDLDNPSKAANRGDNSTDNVEQIYIEYPQPGKYQIHISHKNSLLSGSQDVSVITSGLQKGLFISVKVLLEGAYDPALGAMATSLADQHLLPLDSPFTHAPMSVEAIPENCVDWMVIGLYQLPDSNPVYSKSVFLRNDGQLIDAVTCNKNIRLDVFAGDYYVSVFTRNHFSVTTSHSIHFDANELITYDFTSGPDRYLQPTAATLLPDGQYGLVAADGNQDHFILSEDYILVKRQWGLRGYLEGDYNLDGFIDDTDELLYFDNQGKEKY